MKLLRALVPPFFVVLAACGKSSDETTEPPPLPTVELSVQTAPFVIEPGGEVFKCFYTTLPVDTETAVARFESTMTRGSHHLIVFGLDAPGAPDGTLGSCNLRPAGSALVPIPLYVSQEEHQEAAFPRGVAMPLKARQPIAVQMHYLNPGSTPLTAQVDLKLHALTAGTPFERAGVFASFNTAIDVPAHGTQTVSGSCQVPDDVKFVSLTTHSHRYTTRATVGRVSTDGDGTPKTLVQSLDYERPTVERYASPFLDLAGDKIFYSCEYRNDTDQVVKMGDSAVNEEMCMAVGYYFPASKMTVCLNSLSLRF